MGSRILEWVGGLSSWVLVVAAAGLAFGETAIALDLLVPGEVGMVIVGAAAARSDYPLLPVVVAGMVGAVVGDSVSYAIGRRWGAAVVCRWEFTRRRFEPRIARAERYFHSHGGWLVFVARFVGAFRAVVPLVVGTAGMPYPRFLAWNVVASVTWAGIVVTLGYHFGDEIARFVDRVGLGLSVAAIAAALAWWLVQRRRRRGKGRS